MAPNCLPPELLFEIVPFIPPKCAVPNVFSSCRLLHILLHSRVVKWKEWMKKFGMNPISAKILNANYGLKNPETKSNITLNEAIALGLYDPATRQFLNNNQPMDYWDSLAFHSPNTVHQLVRIGAIKVTPMDMNHALKRYLLDREFGVFHLLEHQISLPEALKYGYIEIPKPKPTFALTLTECIEQNWISRETGLFIAHPEEPRGFGEAMRSNGDWPQPILQCDVRECFDSEKNTRLTITEAVSRGILNLATNTFVDTKNGTQLTLPQAHHRGFIHKPFTLTEAVRIHLLDEGEQFRDGANRHTLLQAIASGLLDPDLRHLSLGGGVFSIREALEKELLLPNGIVVVKSMGEGVQHLSLREAYEKDLLRHRGRNTVFDMKGFRCCEVGAQLLSFNEAIKANILKICKTENDDNVVQFVRGRQSMTIEEAANRGLVVPALSIILTTPGLMIQEKPLSLITAVANSVLNASKGVLLNNGRELSVRDAFDHGWFKNLEAALHLAALLDVHSALLTPSINP
ncbi:hypothetical protein niasHS_018116 [Heterodera schachtii]|uniref:F-box domain-containing protein n=1 Tax=Heterodera schachtii TaxID=97005 RepID=A0ABD2HSI3_HETSC